MNALSPNPLSPFHKREWRNVTPAILDNAIITTQRVLGDKRGGTRVSLRSQIIGLLFGGIAPLISNVAFGWPAYVVVLGIAADNAALWLTDALKSFFASDEFDDQWQEQCDVSDAIGIAKAVTTHSVNAPADAPPKFRAIPSPKYALGFWWTFGIVIALLPLAWGRLFYPSTTVENARIQIFIVCAIPSTVRVLLAMFDFWRQRNSGSSVDLLPQGPPQAFAFLLATLIFVIGSLVFQNDHAGLGTYDGPVFLAIYFICIVIVGFFTLQSLSQDERTLRRLLAVDANAIRLRLAQIDNTW